MDQREIRLFEWVKLMHGDQVRKYTGDPYWVHLLDVYIKYSEYYSNRIGNAVCLCHDLIEDAWVAPQNLFEGLRAVDYTPQEANGIVNCVVDLTDVYTKEAYPDLNRRERKLRESNRLGKVCLLSKTVKCADLIGNSKSIVKHDEKFARTYLREKANMLEALQGAYFPLYLEACGTLTLALDKLGIDIRSACTG